MLYVQPYSVALPMPVGVIGPPTGADLARRAREILQAVAEQRAGLGLTDALLLVHEQFVDNEPRGELRQLGELMVQARRMALVQTQLDDDRERLHHGRLSHEESVETGHHYEMLRYEACSYNHRLRSFIEAHRELVGRPELTDWLTSASQGRRQWVVGEITGALSEVAVHAALMGMPELSNVRYGTVEEDLRGYDFVAQWQGRLLTIDAKTGYYHPMSERKQGHKHLEISVPREELKGFTLPRHGLDLLRREVRRALHAGTAAEYHAPHGRHGRR
jgi:hypothetical protein